jgi:hypothetical protein
MFPDEQWIQLYKDRLVETVQRSRQIVVVWRTWMYSFDEVNFASQRCLFWDNEKTFWHNTARLMCSKNEITDSHLERFVIHDTPLFKVIKAEGSITPWNRTGASRHLATALKRNLNAAITVLWHYSTHNKFSVSCVSLTHGWLNAAKFAFIPFLLLGDLYSFISDG